MKYFVYVMHGSILLVTMPPPPRAHPRVFPIFFLSWRSIPHPRAHRKRQFRDPRALDRPYMRFFATSFLSVQKQNDAFSQFINIFLSLLRGV